MGEDGIMKCHRKVKDQPDLNKDAVSRLPWDPPTPKPKPLPAR